MRIAFDAKRAFHNGAGLGSYARTLLNALGEIPDAPERWLYTPKPGTLFAPANAVIRDGSAWSKWGLGAYWRRYRLGASLRRDGVDLFHGLSNELPRFRRPPPFPLVVTVHDCIAIRRPEEFASLDRWSYRRKIADACERADLVLAPSEQTRRDVLELFRIPESRVVVLPQSCATRFGEKVTPESVESVRGRFQLPTDYVLTVGTVERRKNLHGVIEALARLPKGERPPLVVVGRQRGHARALQERIDALGLRPNVRFLEGVRDEDLPPLYAGARAKVYVSLYEGFGIPVLEAMTVGVPVVTSRGGCLEELGGNAVELVDPADPDEIADALSRLLHDSALAERRRLAGRERARAYDRHRLAEELVGHYRRLVPEKGNLRGKSQ